MTTTAIMRSCLTTPPPSSPRGHFFSPLKGAPRDAPSSPYSPKNYNNDTTGLGVSLKQGFPQAEGKRSEYGHLEDGHEDFISQTECLPPIVHRLTACSKRARSKFRPYNKPPVPSSLELRFTEKSLGRVDSSEITVEDARKGRSIFIRGLMGLSDEAIRMALEARQADRESKRLRALSTAWEIEASERHKNFLLALYDQETNDFNWAADEALFFEKALERRSVKELEDDMDFNIGAYGQDLRSLSLADERIDQMELEISCRGVGLSADNDETSDRLNTILAAAVSAEPDGMAPGTDRDAVGAEVGDD